MELLKFFNDNIKIRLSEDEKDSLKYWSNQIKEGDTSYNANYNKARYLARAYLYKREYVPLIAARMAKGGAPNINGLVFKDLYKINYDCKEALKNFDKPVLIIQGRQDLVGSETAYKAHLVIPNSSIVFIEKCCHFGWLEQEERYKEEIVSFIDGIEG